MKVVKFIRDLLSLTRSLNLLIICSALFMARYTIVKPILALIGSVSGISDNLFLLMTFSTLLIAAGGYIINDYFDVAIDSINKPGKNLIQTTFTKKSTLIAYWLLTISGSVGGFVFGHLSDMRYAGILFLVSAGLLYFYSASYKKMFLVGNLTISFLTALTISLTILFDKSALSASPILILISAYSIFAFLLTLIREIIKDCEDAAGDMEFQANTLPIITSLKTARWLAAILCLVTFITLVSIQILQKQWEDKLSFIYICLFIELPLLYLIYSVLASKNTTDDHRNSNISKLIMVAGLFSMIIFYISFK